MAFQIKKFDSIIASMVNWLSSATNKITDFNVGSVARTMLEAVAIELEELYYQLLKAVEEAIEEAIYRTFNFPRNPSERATGNVTFYRQLGSDQPISVPQSTLVSTGSAPPIYFETQSAKVIPAVSGRATDGSTIKLIDTTRNFVDDGINVGSKVVNITDEGETTVIGVTAITTTLNPYDTLNFGPLTNGASFSKSIPRVFYDDNGVVTDYTTEAEVVDSVYFPTDLVAGEDYLYLGFDKIETAIQFFKGAGIANDIISALSGQYWNGTEWAGLPYFYDGTRDTGTEKPFSISSGWITWSDPGNWVLSAYQTISKYWIRLYVSVSLTSGAQGDALILQGDGYKVMVMSLNVSVQAVQPGVSGNVSANSIISLRTAIPNISSITNIAAFSDGKEEETDLERKARFALYIQSLARATRGALEYAARTVEQIVAAKAIDDVRPTVLRRDFVSDDYDSLWTDITSAMRNPGDPAVKLFEDSEAENDALYIGAVELFDYINMHLVQPGVVPTPPAADHLVWEYYASDGTWKPLPDLVEASDYLQTSGTISFTIPSDWVALTMPPIGVTTYNYQRMWVRLRKKIGGVTYSTTPTGDWASLPPGFGYVFLYCHDGSGGLNESLQATVENAVEPYRGCGIVVEVKAPTRILPTLTAELLIAANYDANEIRDKVNQAIIDYLNAKVLGEDLYIAEIYQFIMDTYDKAILNTNLISPTQDIIVPSSGVIRPDPALITVTATTV